MSGLEDNPEQASQREASTSETTWWAVLLFVLLLSGLACLAVLVLYRIYPDQVPAKANPVFIDIIFETPLVVFAAQRRKNSSMRF